MTETGLLIRNATILDGTGRPGYMGDLVVEGDKVAAVGTTEKTRSATACRCIDAEGLAVCPGFIDIHGHSDLALLHSESPDMLGPFVAQGITTQVIGNCGLGVAPAPAANREALAAFMALISPAGVEWTWGSFREYLEALDRAPLPFNVIPLAAHGALRCSVLGTEPGPARKGALSSMVSAMDAALDAGAFGLSAGLIYPPGMWADTDELAALCERVAGIDRLFACHIRGSSETVLDAEQELLEIAARTGVRTQHSHHEAFGAPYWHLARQTLAMEDAARSAGLDIASDVIPYHAVNTSLLAIYPPWALEGGVPKLCERLENRGQLAIIGSEIVERASQWPPWDDGWAHNLVRATGWDNIVMLQAASDAHGDWMGNSLQSIAEREGRTPFECAAEITVSSHGNVMARYHGVAGAPDDDGVLRDLMCHPDHSIGIDVILKGDGVPHPGGYGAAPRVLGEYSRRRGWFGLAEAVRKMTSLPAARFGLRNRGTLRPGSAADIVLFDPERVAEHGTYDDPARRPSGIEMVILNGVVVVEKGTTLESAAGRLLRPPAPSR